MDKTEKAMKKLLSEQGGGVLPLDGQGQALGDGLSITYDRTRVVPIPQAVLEENRVIAGMTQNAVADVYRALRAKLSLRMPQSRGVNLAICSANPGEGKTLTAVNLAVSLAMDVKNSVMLVDLDLRRPKIHEYIGFPPQQGLCDYLRRDVDLDKCLVNPGIDRLVVLTGGSPASDASELVSSPRMIALAAELKSRYMDRIVIYDMPPLLIGDLCLAFLPNTDASLLVVCDHKTKKGEFEGAVGMLKPFNLIGVVMNNSDNFQRATGYTY